MGEQVDFQDKLAAKVAVAVVVIAALDTVVVFEVIAELACEVTFEVIAELACEVTVEVVNDKFVFVDFFEMVFWEWFLYHLWEVHTSFSIRKELISWKQLRG